jgi:Fe-S cluster biogenesis protein NfuA
LIPRGTRQSESINKDNMEKKNAEIVQLKASDEKPGADEKGGKLETAKKDEVGGRALVQTIGQCSYCGFIGTFTYDTNAYHYYTCANCGRTLRA